MQQKLLLSNCVFILNKYFGAGAAFCNFLSNFFPFLPLFFCCSFLSLLCCSFPFFFFLTSSLFFSCISVQALLNTPVFHMLLLCNLSSTLWKPHDLFMLMDFPCIQLDPCFPTVSSYWMWPSGPTARAYTPQSWHSWRYLSCSAMISWLYKQDRSLLAFLVTCFQPKMNRLSFSLMDPYSATVKSHTGTQWGCQGLLMWWKVKHIHILTYKV